MIFEQAKELLISQLGEKTLKDKISGAFVGNKKDYEKQVSDILNIWYKKIYGDYKISHISENLEYENGKVIFKFKGKFDNKISQFFRERGLIYDGNFKYYGNFKIKNFEGEFFSYGEDKTLNPSLGFKVQLQIPDGEKFVKIESIENISERNSKIIFVVFYLLFFLGVFIDNITGFKSGISNRMKDLMLWSFFIWSCLFAYNFLIYKQSDKYKEKIKKISDERLKNILKKLTSENSAKVNLFLEDLENNFKSYKFEIFDGSLYFLIPYNNFFLENFDPFETTENLSKQMEKVYENGKMLKQILHILN